MICIEMIPGDIFEFGTRFGHNMVVFENLRAVYEPFNKPEKLLVLTLLKVIKIILIKTREVKFSRRTLIIQHSMTMKSVENYLGP